MWLTWPDGLANITPGTVLVEYRHQMGSYPTRTEEEQTDVGHEVGAIFCTFLQGAVLGWEVVDRDRVVVGQRRDQISIHEYVSDLDLYQLSTKLGIAEPNRRALCRDDVLAFATEQHKVHGTMRAWDVSAFQDAGFARMPYPQSLLEGVVEDLLAEKKLDGTFDGGDWLKPELYEQYASRTHQVIENWCEALKGFGLRRKWISAESIATMSNKVMAADPTRVFVVHGRDEQSRKAIFEFLRAIGLHPLEWSEVISMTGKAAPYVGEILYTAFSKARAVVVVMTPEDEARLMDRFVRPDDPSHERELTPQARPNVLFEAGMAMGRNPERTVLVEFGKLRPFSDIGGRHVIRINNSTERRQELAERLRMAGCLVNLAGTDWHTAGDFPE
jgi:predicted nucleotide-binding protein